MKNKSKKISLFQYILTSMAVAVIAVTGTVFFYEWQLRKTPNYSFAGSQGNDFASVEQLYHLIRDNYAGEVDTQALINGAMNGMTEAIGDPYSSFMVGEEAEEFDSSISGSFGGIGASMTMKNNLPTVAEPPIKGSPAERARLKVDDVILEVDGESTEGLSLSEVVSKVRGEKGTDVALTISRGNDTFTLTITRDIIPVESVTGNLDETHKTIGYVRIKSFSQTTSDEFKTTVKDLRKQGAESFIVDVRSNPGGVLTEVEKVASMFLKDGKVIVQFEDADGQRSRTKAGKELDDGFKVTEPAVILVNENSASASEVLAAALKESAGIDVIGTTTFGKGTVQQMIPFEQAEVKLTTGKWLTPDGNWVNEKGLAPTIEQKLPDFAYLTVFDTSVTYEEGMSGEAVGTIQEMLKATGDFTGKADQTFSSETAEAVKSFQQTHELPVTGKVDQATAQTLSEVLYELILESDTQYERAVKELT